MENDILNKLWNENSNSEDIQKPDTVIAKANEQRNKQKTGIIVMGITVVILLVYAAFYLPSSFNNFSLGLVLMIASLSFRVIVEIYSRLKKTEKLTSMDTKSYSLYLEKYYQWRMKINYILTPICFTLYCYGLYILYPFFKREFSNGFYIYLIVSGIVSLIIIGLIIINQIHKETRFLKSLRNKSV
ncbi:MAG: hypothetical protein ACSHWW_04705 [Nonlabens sp.]|uniref:hypothetical protein n=1 Tax=Nonlabens sp. TaxID=1888209 RepID=UPI003EF1E3AA